MIQTFCVRPDLDSPRILRGMILMLILGAFSMCAQSSGLSRLLPPNLSGWSQSGKDKAYGSKTLYEYIDGGAELYLSYGFQSMINRIYTAENQPDILVDLFDMGHSYNAYGVFSHAREKEDEQFGQGSQVVPGLIVFWKDRYFISILATPETPQSKEAMFRIASTIDENIVAEGSLPDVLNTLPEEGVVPGSIRFFTHPVWLNSYGFIADDNLFFISDRTEAVLAKVDTPVSKSLLLIVTYSDTTLARSALDHFRASYFKTAGPAEVMEMEDGSWTGYNLNGSRIAVVFDGPDRGTTSALLKSVR